MDGINVISVIINVVQNFGSKCCLFWTKPMRLCCKLLCKYQDMWISAPNQSSLLYLLLYKLQILNVYIFLQHLYIPPMLYCFSMGQKRFCSSTDLTHLNISWCLYRIHLPRREKKSSVIHFTINCHNVIP